MGGAGTWGRYYLRTFAQHPRCEVIALVDRARDRRQAFADRYGVPAVFDDVEELLAREVPDIVSVILPVAYTAGVVLKCAEAGVKVVSCEKPIAAQLSQADALIDRCRELGTILGCGTARWGPYLPQIIDWIKAGHIGALTAVAMPNGLEREVSGGACHDLVLMRLLTGREVEWVAVIGCGRLAVRRSHRPHPGPRRRPPALGGVPAGTKKLAPTLHYPYLFSCPEPCLP